MMIYPVSSSEMLVAYSCLLTFESMIIGVVDDLFLRSRQDWGCCLITWLKSWRSHWEISLWCHIKRCGRQNSV